MNPDEKLLSRYLDGALTPEMTAMLTDCLLRDAESRDRLMRLVGVQAGLKSLGNGVVAEEIPESVVQMVRDHGRKRDSHSWWMDNAPLRYMAVLVMFVLAFVFGKLVPQPSLEVPFFPVIPEELAQAVNVVLERSPSGRMTDWAHEKGGMHARIEPIRTFRGKDGAYYRMYLLEFVSGKSVQPYVGVARRAGKEMWQTRSLHLRDQQTEI